MLFVRTLSQASTSHALPAMLFAGILQCSPFCLVKALSSISRDNVQTPNMLFPARIGNISKKNTAYWDTDIKYEWF